MDFDNNFFESRCIEEKGKTLYLKDLTKGNSKVITTKENATIGSTKETTNEKTKVNAKVESLKISDKPGEIREELVELKEVKEKINQVKEVKVNSVKHKRNYINIFINSNFRFFLNDRVIKRLRKKIKKYMKRSNKKNLERKINKFYTWNLPK